MNAVATGAERRPGLIDGSVTKIAVEVRRKVMKTWSAGGLRNLSSGAEARLISCAGGIGKTAQLETCVATGHGHTKHPAIVGDKGRKRRLECARGGGGKTRPTSGVRGERNHKVVKFPVDLAKVPDNTTGEKRVAIGSSKRTLKTWNTRSFVGSGTVGRTEALVQAKDTIRVLGFDLLSPDVHLTSGVTRTKKGGQSTRTRTTAILTTTNPDTLEFNDCRERDRMHTTGERLGLVRELIDKNVRDDSVTRADVLELIH